MSLHLVLPTLSLWSGTCFVGVPWNSSTSVEVSCYMAKLSDVWCDLFCQCCIHLESPEYIFHFLRRIIPSLLPPPPYHCESCLVGFPQLFLQLLNELFLVLDCNCWYDYLAKDAWTSRAGAGACARSRSGAVAGAGSWTGSGGGSRARAETGAEASWYCWCVNNWPCFDVLM